MNSFQELASCLNSAYLCFYSKIFTIVASGAREGDKTNVVLSSRNLYPNVLRKWRTSLPFILQVLIINSTHNIGFSLSWPCCISNISECRTDDNRQLIWFNKSFNSLGKYWGSKGITEKECPEIDFNPFFHLLSILSRQLLERNQSLPCLGEKNWEFPGIYLDYERVWVWVWMCENVSGCFLSWRGP